MPKPKIAIYWCSSCGGCEEAIVDLAEGIIDVLAAVDIVFWPVALDFKQRDVAALPDGSIAATLLNGAIRTDEQAEMARLLRRKSQVLIAYGACACHGGIPALANQFSREQILQFVYEGAPTTANDAHFRPRRATTDGDRTLRLPEFHQVVRALDQVIDVDYYLPGCPPTPALTRAALTTVLEGKLPPKGTVLAPDVALCEHCPRRQTKPVDVNFTEFRRPHLTLLDPQQCFLAQGVVCMGPATRGGCEGACLRANMPCTGCFGPTSRVRDQGAKMLSSLAANVAAREPAEAARVLEGIPDPVGTFYRYGLAKSFLRRKVEQPAAATAAP